MGTKEKLVDRFKKLPKDFTFDEMNNLLVYFGYERCDKGKTSGSRVMYFRKKDKRKICFHVPHNPPIVKMYAMKATLDTLIGNGDIGRN